ncbi:sigma-70 family RNA polymerase sigma factor [Nakamurella sp. YIM 132087]|uniref:Sigma-70 family RNA polymerase sigma factor n=2 Tax=Nakamurella alba TaxID=2665158 RepID=A0A7K1FQ22_9ACTN|nr:sigma-70 family RNA polymerase sigma factor [Nakamurella alba]
MTALATLLGADDPENIAQEAFVRLHGRMHRLRDPEAARAYLRTTVVNLCRSRARHLTVVDKHREPVSRGTVPSAEDEVLAADTSATAAALQALSPRHREALVLRYWLDLSDADLAASMGVSAGTARTHLSRGLAALRAALTEAREAP